MDPITYNTTLGAAGALEEKVYVEDVFATHLYDGATGIRDIDSGLNYFQNEGMVWIKSRNDTTTRDHVLTDTLHSTGIGNGEILHPNTNGAMYSDNTQVYDLGPTGFTVSSSSNTNENGKPYVSWGFLSQKGFFDVVKYTGTGANRSINHSLGSVPGCILIKCTSRAGDDWIVYHRSLGNTKFLNLNQNYAASTDPAAWNSSTPTSTVFYLGDKGQVNDLNQEYVAYIFAHDSAIFGDTEDQSIIKCGTFTTDASYNGSVTLGWEPQWVMVKSSSAAGGWFIHDVLRGAPVDGDSSWLRADTDANESSSSVAIRPNPTGFTSYNHSASTDMVYIAIRRPHKPPEAATDVLDIAAATSYALNAEIPCDFAPDFMIATSRSTNLTNYAEPRLTDNWHDTSSTSAENTTNYFKWDGRGGKINLPTSSFTADPIFYQFRRAPGFFDVVAYAGTGSAQNVNHNLEVTPELMIVKSRSAGNWNVYSSATGATKHLNLNNSIAATTSSNRWNNTAPTSSVFTVGTTTSISGEDFIAYLFASCPNVSKIGTYSGNTGGTVNVDCGFTGVSFVLIKRTDTSGDWYLWDKEQGLSAGNDPYLLLNDTAAQTTGIDYIDPNSQGFRINAAAPAALNETGGTYLFFAIALYV